MSSRDKQKQLQTCLAEARAQLDRAQELADELGESFEFLGLIYLPKKTIMTGGHWEWSDWGSSWNSSGTGC